MKKFKKLSALLLAVIMTLAMAVPAFAGTATTSTLSVTDLKNSNGEAVAGSVNLYRIAEVSENGEIDWVKDETGYKFADAYEPTSQEINTIANNVVLDATTFPAVAMTVSGSTATYSYTNNEGKGAIYIAVPVANDGKTVFNPIVLATTNVAKALTDASVSAGSTYRYGETAKAKKTDSTSYKEIISGVTVDPTAPKDENDENGDDDTYDHASNDNKMKTADANVVIGYKATIDPIPVYPDTASNKSLWIKDTLQDSLYYVDKDAVAIRLYDSNDAQIGADIVVGSDTFKNKTDVTDANKAALLACIEYTGAVGSGEESFTVVFDYDKIVAAGAARVDVIYAAKLDPDKAEIGHIPNTNTLEYYYSLKPTNGGGFKPGTTPTPNSDYAREVDKEDVYTYKIGLLKTDDNGVQLSGATFEIYDNAECTGTPLDTVVSDANGIVEYNGIVKYGTYYFKETKAPNGYTIDEAHNPVAVEAKWTSVTKTKSSKEYCVDPSEVDTTKGGSTEQVGWIKDGIFIEGVANKPSGKDTPNTDETPGAQEVFPAYLKCVISTSVTSYNPDNDTPIGYNFGSIKNSSLTELPSTGGIGTYIFTIAGVAILAIAAFLLIFKRRKVEE